TFLRPFTNLDQIHSDQKLRVGQKVYIQNTPLYLFRHPEGIAQGENLIYLGRGRFCGFGLASHSYKEKDIKEILYNNFALAPTAADKAFIQINQNNLSPSEYQKMTSLQNQTHFDKVQIMNEMEVSAGLAIDPTRFLHYDDET